MFIKPKALKILVVTVLLSVIATYFSLKNGLSLEDLRACLRKFSWKKISLATTLCFLQASLMALKVWALCPSKTPVGLVYRAVCQGQFANAFLPLRTGDFYKLAVLGSKESGMTYTTATGVLVADRLTDIAALTFCILFSGSFLVPEFTLSLPNSVGFISLILFLVCSALFLFWHFFLKKRLGGYKEKLDLFLKGLRLVLSWPHFFLSTLFGIAGWICEALTLFILVNSQGYPLTVAQIFAVLTVLNLAISVPVSAANLGTFEGAVVLSFKRLAIPFAPAMAVATVHHICQITGTGIASLLGFLFNLRPRRL